VLGLPVCGGGGLVRAPVGVWVGTVGRPVEPPRRLVRARSSQLETSLHRFDTFSGHSPTTTISGAQSSGASLLESRCAVWNNDGDTPWLVNPQGKKIDTCKYAGGDTSAYC
jgi:hypothetical protein